VTVETGKQARNVSKVSNEL